MMKVHAEHSGAKEYQRIRAAVEHRIEDVLCAVKPRTLQHAMVQAIHGGKMIRPILTMLSCSSVGGRQDAAVDAATAIELLHISSLIHDDIMDDASFRRGIATIHTTHGVSMAILAGDTFVALAFQVLQNVGGANRDRIAQIFTDSFRQVCEGQGYDLCLALDNCIEEGAHTRMVEKKTAKLMQSATEIGALTGTASEQHVHTLSRFGYNLGMAFQAQDDVLDAIGDEKEMGKPVLADVRNGRSTFVTSGSAVAVTGSDDDGDTLCAARHLVKVHTEAACACLDTLPPSGARELLRLLAESLMQREA